MSLKERLNDEMKAALLSGNRFVGETLRNLKAAILNEEVASGKRDEGLSDEEIERVIAREVKKRNESATMYRDNGRPELAEPEEKESQILSAYLPQQLSEDELRAATKVKIEALGVSGLQAVGQLIGALKKDFGTAADGATLARIVKEELSN